ncbi:unnamed protein product [Rotaria sordida]|uniref:PBZ-type domain-containing protein n=1 Tax=Rotaria sordida TaxID=392033 RepID=A0A815T868_9BILA|nr:unnamed protein product [Rotaria sordida]
MKPCSNFTPHEWKRDICCECFEKKENHISNQVTARIGSTVTLTSSGTEQKSSSTNQSDRKSSGFNRETIAAFEKILESTAPNDENIAIKLSKNNPMNIHKTSDASELNVSRENSNVSEQNTVTNALLKGTEDSSSEKGTHPKELKPCQYGMECRRQNPTHFEEYSHPPGFTIKLACINQTTELSFKQRISRKEIKPCRYGMKCRRQNPTHFEEYSHPPGFTMISTTIYPVTEPLLEKEKKLHIINAKPLEDLDTKKINETNSQKVTTLEQKLLEQQNVSEKHVRLVEERFRASIADSEAKIKKAVLGDVHIAQVYDKKKYRGNDENRVRRPPLKGNDIDLYDSVLGESKKHGGDILKYREVILYESGQAYPEYVIEYRRSALNAKPSSGAKRAKDMCYNFFRIKIF